MIKPWKDRVEEAAHFREEDYINDVQYFMQAEIEELRTENARLKAALLTNDTTIESANNAAGMLEAENARMRDALADMVDAVTGVDQISAVNAARAALGEKS